MKCILNITRSDVKRKRLTSIRIPSEKFDTREKSPVSMGNLDMLVRGQVLLVDTKVSRLTLDLSKKRERTTFAERTDEVKHTQSLGPRRGS